ncbi:MAG TPA: hypothetical protein VH951_09515 [Dehalococcoidia bacterium]
MDSIGDADVLSLFDKVFAAVPRPERFTDHPGCCECEEHEALLQSRDRPRLKIDDVGSQAWNPITMATPEAFVYFLPALARLALEPVPETLDWYGYIILFELRWDGPGNKRLVACTPAQRRAVVALLEHLFDSRAEDIQAYQCENEVLEAIAIWAE